MRKLGNHLEALSGGRLCEIPLDIHNDRVVGGGESEAWHGIFPQIPITRQLVGNHHYVQSCMQEIRFKASSSPPFRCFFLSIISHLINPLLYG